MPAVYTFMLFADVDWSTPLLPPAALPHVPLLSKLPLDRICHHAIIHWNFSPTIPTTANLPSPRSTTTTTTTTTTTPFHPPLVFKRRRKVSWRHQCPQHSYLHIQAKKWPLSFHEEKQQPNLLRDQRQQPTPFHNRLLLPQLNNKYNNRLLQESPCLRQPCKNMTTTAGLTWNKYMYTGWGQ